MPSKEGSVWSFVNSGFLKHIFKKQEYQETQKHAEKDITPKEKTISLQNAN